MNQIAPLNHYLTEVPQKNFFNLKCKALAYNILEKISYVALIAIMATVFTIAYSSIAVTGTASLIVAGLVLSTPLFACGITKFSVWSTQFSRLAEVEGQTVLHFKKIADWKTPQIEQFLREQGLDPARIPLDGLRQINPTEPLCALLPLIARFNYLKDEARREEETSKNMLATECNEITDVDKRRNIVLFTNRMGWTAHEFKAIPTALNAAILLQIMQTPTDRDLDIQQPTESLAIPKIGICRAKAFDEREWGRRKMNDEYLVFHEALHRPSLTLAEIEQNMDPRALRLKLFPNAVRA